MQIAFYKASRGTFTDKLSGWWTRPSFWKFWESGLYSHVEILFPNNICFSASPRDGGTRWKEIDDIYTSGNWDIVYVGMENREAQLKLQCNKDEGKKYDWMCIFLTFVFPFDIHEPHRFTCSEYVSNRVFNLPHASRYSPNGLARILNYALSINTKKI